LDELGVNFQIHRTSKSTSYTKSKPSRVSIVTVTNRNRYLENVLENYKRQNYGDKELIIILNDNSIIKEEWTERVIKDANISIYQLDENITLGDCLNFGVDKAKYEYIAKFDDDDYYGTEYLKDSMKYFNNKIIGIVGKRANYIYFEKSKEMAIVNAKFENRFVDFVTGPTMIVKKEVFNKVRFPSLNIEEDRSFQSDCLKNGIKIFSTDRFNFVYVRHGDIEKHTWEIEDDKLKEWCTILGTVKDYTVYGKKNVNTKSKYHRLR